MFIFDDQMISEPVEPVTIDANRHLSVQMLPVENLVAQPKHFLQLTSCLNRLDDEVSALERDSSFRSEGF